VECRELILSEMHFDPDVHARSPEDQPLEPDLVCARRKRYAFADPLLRVWVRLNSRCAAADPDRTLDEVQRYAVARLTAGSVTPR